MAKVPKLSHARLTELLDYDPASGFFRWKARPSNRVHVGDRAGVFHRPSGGRYVAIDGEKFMAHRLAFFYVNKRWPDTDVRPSDGDYDHCWIANLIEVRRVDLAHQREKTRKNTSGHLGVAKARGGLWQATITWNYKQIGLGANFESAAEAGIIYDEAARRLKGATSENDVDRIVAEVRLFRRQRAVWRNFERRDTEHAWPSFEAFCAEVREIPQRRYAIVAVDVTQPIGPGNFRWALPVDAEHSTRDGMVAYHRVVRRANRDHVRNKQLSADFGIDMSEYLRMLNDQAGVCAICEKAETKSRGHDVRALSVDHDHNTQAVRALLCGNCNQGLGYFCDDPALLRRAVAYLEKYSDSRRAWSMPSLTEITHLPIGQKLLQGAA